MQGNNYDHINEVFAAYLVSPRKEVILNNHELPLIGITTLPESELEGKVESEIPLTLEGFIIHGTLISFQKFGRNPQYSYNILITYMNKESK